jgi:hypothetical protein
MRIGELNAFAKFVFSVSREQELDGCSVRLDVYCNKYPKKAEGRPAGPQMRLSYE